eukprot:5509959-Prymnesium_polylepis.1
MLRRGLKVKPAARSPLTTHHPPHTHTARHAPLSTRHCPRAVAHAPLPTLLLPTLLLAAAGPRG